MATPEHHMPGADRDEETGKYTDKYPDAAFLDTIRDHDGLPTTPSIAEAVGCNRRTAYNRLTELEERGDVVSQEAGRTLVWMLAEGDESKG